MEPEIFTIPEVARTTGIPKPTLYEYVRRGVVSSINVAGIKVITKEELDNLTADYKAAARFRRKGS